MMSPFAVSLAIGIASGLVARAVGAPLAAGIGTRYGKPPRWIKSPILSHVHAVRDFINPRNEGSRVNSAVVNDVRNCQKCQEKCYPA